MSNVGTIECPECGNTLDADTPYCGDCGWEYKNKAQKKIEQLAEDADPVGHGQVYHARVPNWVAGNLKRDVRVEIFNVSMPNDDEMDVSFQIDTSDWPTCPECGAILNFNGECANGHRTDELRKMWEAEVSSMLDDELTHHFNDSESWDIHTKTLADEIASRFEHRVEHGGT